MLRISVLVLALITLPACKLPKYPPDQRVFASGYIPPGEAAPCKCGGSPPGTPGLAEAQSAWDLLIKDFQSELKTPHRIGDRSYQVPGGAIAVVWKGQLLYKEGFGQRALETDYPFASNTLATSGSLSKMITATTVLRLVEQGLLDLDTPVSKYLSRGSVRLSRRVEDQVAADRITMRQLLSHSAGIPDELPSGIDEYGPSVCSQGADAFASYFELHAEDPLWSEPGAVWNYSNPAYFLAAAVIEAVTGESFEAASQRLVLGPAGMKTASWDGAAAEQGNFAAGYEVWSPAQELPRLRRFSPASTPCRVFQPAAGLKASVEDYAQYAMAMMRPDQALLSPKSTALLLQPQMQTYDQAWAYSLGFFVDPDYKGKKLLAHDGAAWGYRALFIMVPEDDFALIIMQNAGLSFPERLWELGLAATDRFLGLPAGPRPSLAKQPKNEVDLAGTYQGWSFDSAEYTEARPSYLALTSTIERDPISQQWRWQEDIFGPALLQVASWPQIELAYPNPTDNIRLRVVADSKGDGLYLVSRSYVAKRMSR